MFCESRRQVEALAAALRPLEVETFLSHSSLSVEERRLAESAFANSRDCVIVSTSTLELGINVGDLDRVIQLGGPNTVASLLQRLGRAGRRPGPNRNMLLLGVQEDDFLQAAAVLQLSRPADDSPRRGQRHSRQAFQQGVAQRLSLDVVIDSEDLTLEECCGHCRVQHATIDQGASHGHRSGHGEIHHVEVVVWHQACQRIQKQQEVVGLTRHERRREIDVTRVRRMDGTAEQHKQIDLVLTA